MPKFVVTNSFLHNHVLRPAGTVLDLSEFEAKRLGHLVARAEQQSAVVVKQEEQKAEAQKAEQKPAPPKKDSKPQASASVLPKRRGMIRA